jgi:hypothetical protein
MGWKMLGSKKVGHETHQRTRMFMTGQKAKLTETQPVTTGIVVIATRTGCFTCRLFGSFPNENYYE